MRKLAISLTAGWFQAAVFLILELSIGLSRARSQDLINREIVEQDASRWVQMQVGELPIILSAPHGGNLAVPGVSERTGDGLATGPAGFFTGRDTGTEELAREVSVAIQNRFGKLPFAVISRVNRKYMDPNRPADIAFEDAKIKPIYELYHQTLGDYCRTVADRFQVGVLIDLHGQGTRRDTVFRGTKNGLTVTRLRETFGESAHQGPNSLFGLLQKRGWAVGPVQLADKEQSGFAGGFIVQTYGSHRATPIDAMQFEFGADYRLKDRRAETARVLADALADYANAYLRMKVPVATPHTEVPLKQSIHVAVFVDKGVSPTDKLFEALSRDTRLSADKVNASDIREGKLSKYSVLIHPGGSGSAQGKTLGEEGRQKVREFVESGRGYVGVCAGAYLASCEYDWSLHMLDAKVIDRMHWNRGSGNVSLAISPLGKKMLQIDKESTDIYYHQGPLLAPGEEPLVPDYQSLATFDGEIVMNGAPSGIMKGTTAIAMGVFGKGRVICFSPHPEKTPNLEFVLLEGIRWAAVRP